jgi:serine/threonine protein phosphatase 1
MKQRTFVLGDLHGAYRAMMQCFDRAKFDYENDRLIFLGDVYDGWSEAGLCIDELLKVKNLIYLLGNHDDWTLQWALTGEKPKTWLSQGGQHTIDCYNGKILKRHVDYLLNARLYYLENNILFLHAGFLPDMELEKQDKEILLWDRSFIESVMGYSRFNRNAKFTKYDEIYFGHTPTIKYGKSYPFNCGEIWLMDTGAGWNGFLSIMNIETKEYFCSDNVTELYPDERGRF